MLSIDSWWRFALTEVFAVLLLVFVYRRPLREGKATIWLKLVLSMLAMYMAHLFYAVLSPAYFYRRFEFTTERLNLIPFRALREWLAHPLNFFGNVLIFMPLGVFEVLLHPGRSRKWQIAFSAATAFFLSLFIEFAQFFNFRVPDIDDIILNTIGALLGALMCMLMQKIGFDRTRIGRVLLPRIPESWHRHNLLNRFCIILVVVMEVVLFTTNYIVTIPKPKTLKNVAAQVDLSTPAPTPFPVTVAPGQTQPVATPAPSSQPVPERTYDVSELTLEAENVLLVRLGDGIRGDQAVFAAGSADPIYPASTLKMLTALTVLDIAAPDELVKVGREIYIPPYDASRAGLEYGMILSVQELLEGLLLPSGADAAYALGVYCGRKHVGIDDLPSDDAINVFIARMNKKAQEIGAVHTTAVNVVGLDDSKQLTTAEDILKIARVFLSNPILADICHLPTDTITSEEGKTVSLKNTNKMLLSSSEYYNRDVAGVKTGTTSRAGNCLVALFTVGGERYISIVMNSSYYGKFTDTQKLYDLCAGY